MTTKVLRGVVAALAALVLPATASAKVLLWEDFTSALRLHQGELGARWKVVPENPGSVTATVVDDGGNAVLSLSGAGTAIVGDPAWGDYTLDVDVKVVDASYWAWGAGAFFRVTGGGTIGTSDAYVFQGRAPDYAGMQLEQWNAGASWNWLQDSGQQMTPGEWHHLKVTVTGPRIQAWLDGAPSIDVTDPSGTHLAGAVGARVWGAGAYFDNFQVTDAQTLPAGYLAVEDFSSGGLDPRWTVHDVDANGALEAEVVEFQGRNVLRMNNSGMVVLGDPAWSSYTAETEVYVYNDWYSAWKAGLQVRSTDPMGAWSNTAAYSAAGRPWGMQLERYGSNFEWWEWLIDVPPAVSSQAWHKMKVICEGPSFRLFLDGEQVGTTTDPRPYLTGQAGFVTYGGGAYFTNLVVRENDAAAPITTAALGAGANAAGWFRGPAAVQLDAVDAGLAGVREVRFALDGDAETVVPGASASVAVTTDGAHALAFRAVDADLNAEVARTLAVNVDAAAPVPAAPAISGTLGNDGWYRSTNVQLRLAAADATSGVAGLSWQVNGGQVKTVAAATTTVVANEGSTQLTWGATDVAGNEAAGEPVAVNVDSIAPAVSVAVSPASIKASGALQPVTVTASATDATSGLAGAVSLKVTNASGAVVATVSSGATIQLLGAKGERYTFTATATDVAGNVGTKVVTVDAK